MPSKNQYLFKRDNSISKCFQIDKRNHSPLNIDNKRHLKLDQKKGCWHTKTCECVFLFFATKHVKCKYCACIRNKESFANSHIIVNILIIIFFDTVCFASVIHILDITTVCLTQCNILLVSISKYAEKEELFLIKGVRHILLWQKNTF